MLGDLAVQEGRKPGQDDPFGGLTGQVGLWMQGLVWKSIEYASKAVVQAWQDFGKRTDERHCDACSWPKGASGFANAGCRALQSFPGREPG